MAAWSGPTFTWGDEARPGGADHGQHLGRARLPVAQRPGSRAGSGRLPVGSFPANGYGLFDMAGNVWEWTRGLVDPPQHPADAATVVLRPGRTRAAATSGAVYDPAQPQFASRRAR